MNGPRLNDALPIIEPVGRGWDRMRRSGQGARAARRPRARRRGTRPRSPSLAERAVLPRRHRTSCWRSGSTSSWAMPGCSTSATSRSSPSARTRRPSSRPAPAGRRGRSLIRRAIAVAAVAGVMLGAPTLRLRGDYLAIVTLGFGEIVRIAARTARRLGEAAGITGIPHPSTWPASSSGASRCPTTTSRWSAIVVARSCSSARLNRRGVGRAWAAMREDEDAAELDGRAHVHHEAVGVRHRCVDRRTWRAGSTPAG